jgi:ADP-heptose:LPS heptosyltransferase
MAAAFGVPELVFFGPSDETIWRPWRTEAEVLKADPIHEIDVDSAMLALQRLHVSAA